MCLIEYNSSKLCTLFFFVSNRDTVLPGSMFCRWFGLSVMLSNTEFAFGFVLFFLRFFLSLDPVERITDSLFTSGVLLWVELSFHAYRRLKLLRANMQALNGTCELVIWVFTIEYLHHSKCRSIGSEYVKIYRQA